MLSRRSRITTFEAAFSAPQKNDLWAGNICYLLSTESQNHIFFFQINTVWKILWIFLADTNVTFLTSEEQLLKDAIAPEKLTL